MSRNVRSITDTTTVAFGEDHALGGFYDIMDSRYADSGNDQQGEGYVVEWCEVFGFTTNLIGITTEGLKDPAVIEAHIVKFLEQ